ncbi:sigma-70 family RNA polymerase sigma factor [Mycolicibacterium sp. P1-18]|uniref:sigma-70 family RNA polymerase sigma factor n=1 Tax=Mycolicibacterium sp. P1-18 TaxID=2024615 RepID=UPI0011F1C1B5|nr:sigma-70 family RNA polymerase sigma factor [Mycolicibacterium sp. P1-18]KAA0096639.1 sigma-70 family RNA polymerase sigma factor [Mycolicibacterium sp. P1-18]
MLPADPSVHAEADAPESTTSRLAARFTEEVIPHTAYLLGHAIGLTHQRSDAEDLVQETMIKAYVSFATFREGSNVKSWLYRIMANTWVDRHRSSLRRPAEQLHGDLTDPQLASQARIEGSLPSAESEALTSIPGEAEVALSELPPDLREIVYYADVQGYRNTEVAEMLQIPVGTVGSRLFRGRRELRAKLTERCCADDCTARRSA